MTIGKTLLYSLTGTRRLSELSMEIRASEVVMHHRCTGLNSAVGAIVMMLQLGKVPNACWYPAAPHSPHSLERPPRRVAGKFHPYSLAEASSGVGAGVPGSAGKDVVPVRGK
jgi:hypothetical protein